MTKILDDMNTGPDDVPGPDTLDLEAVKARHAQRLSEFARWKSDIWPEEYDDLSALIAEVERLRRLLVKGPDPSPLLDENRRLSERLSDLQREAWWFRPTGKPTSGDSGGLL